MKRNFIAVTLGLTLFGCASFTYAQDYIPEQNQADNTVDVVVVNNSGQAITYVNSVANNSTCNIVFPTAEGSPTSTQIIPAGGYFIAHAIMGSGNGVVCEYNFTYADKQNLHLEVTDPTYYYAGGVSIQMFLDTHQVVSAGYPPVQYPSSDPTGLMDSSDTLILNSL